MTSFTIPGKPVPKGRPRVYRKRAVTPARTSNYETLVQHAARSARVRPLDGPLEVWLAFFWPARRPHRKRNPREQELRPCGADIDNCAKAVLDALNGIAYADDSQVVRLHAVKWYAAQGDPARTEVRIERLP